MNQYKQSPRHISLKSFTKTLSWGLASLLLSLLSMSAQVTTSPGTELLPIQRDGLYGFMRRDGSVAIPPKFEMARSFSEGRAPIRLNHMWGFADTTGAVVV